MFVRRRHILVRRAANRRAFSHVVPGCETGPNTKELSTKRVGVIGFAPGALLAVSGRSCLFHVACRFQADCPACAKSPHRRGRAQGKLFRAGTGTMRHALAMARSEWGSPN